MLLSACGDAAPGADRAAGQDAVVAIDDLGREVRLARPARRVVSLMPSATETLLALGADSFLVGRTDYDHDPRVAGVASVGGGLDPSLEALVALKPDLVVAFETAGGRLRHRLEALGIPVFAVETRDTADVFRNIRSLGRLVGRAAAADSLERHVRARLDSVRASVPEGERPTVLYVVSVDPPMPAGMDNFHAELIGVAGGRPLPISAEHPGRAPVVSLEELVRRQPDVVILPVGEDPMASVERLRREPGWRDLRAVREGRVALVPAEVTNRPGPRIGETARLLREALRAHWSGR